MNILRVKKIFFCFILSIFTFLYTDNVFAVNTTDSSSTVKGVFDDYGTRESYKMSNEVNDIYLPFVRYASERLTIDKSTSNIGAFFSGKSIEVNNDNKGLKFLVSSDTTRINANMEYPIILSGQDVVIDSNIDRSIIVISGGKVTITSKANIKEDIIVLSDSLEISGNVNGSVIGVSKNLDITGKIGKDLRINTENINVASKENISGNIFVRTSNNLTNLKENYPNANIEFISAKKINNKVEVLEKITNIIKDCLLLSILYVIIVKLSNKKIFSNIIEISKNHPLFIIVSSFIALVTIPIIITLLLILSIIGLSIITVPIMIIYITFLAITIMLSTFIVGSMCFDYVKNRYLKDSNKWLEMLGVFFTFAILKLTVLIPSIGSYLSFIIVMAAIGIIITYIFKNSKEKK